MHSPPEQLPSRVVVENVEPEVDGGRFPAKRTIGDEVAVSADVHADGHDVLAAVLRYRRAGDGEWTEVDMAPAGNDRWTARFTAAELGRYEYMVQAWVDRFAAWRRDLAKRVEAGQDVKSELLEGAELVRQAARRDSGPDGDWLRGQAELLARNTDPAGRVQAALEGPLATLMARHADRSRGATYPRVLRLTVEQERARYGAWYELFPRSCAS